MKWSVSSIIKAAKGKNCYVFLMKRKNNQLRIAVTIAELIFRFMKTGIMPFKTRCHSNGKKGLVRSLSECNRKGEYCAEKAKRSYSFVVWPGIINQFLFIPGTHFRFFFHSELDFFPWFFSTVQTVWFYGCPRHFAGRGRCRSPRRYHRLFAFAVATLWLLWRRGNQWTSF